jgi:hypothetical protein
VEEEMKESEREHQRKARLVALWQLRPSGKRTENDLAIFYRYLEKKFAHLLNRRCGDPYQSLKNELRQHIEQKG